MSKTGEDREISVVEGSAPEIPDVPDVPEGLPEGVMSAHGDHDPSHLGAETGARHDVAGGDARARSLNRDAGEDITPDRFRAAFRPSEAVRGEGEEPMDTVSGSGQAGGPKDTWGHESDGAMGVLGNALAFVWSGWRRALERNALAMKREGRLRELGVRLATLSGEERLGAAEYDSGVRAILCQLEQIAEAEAELDAETP